LAIRNCDILLLSTKILISESLKFQVPTIGDTAGPSSSLPHEAKNAIEEAAQIIKRYLNLFGIIKLFLLKTNV